MERLVRGAMRSRGQVLAVTLALLVVLAWFARGLTLDALPDVTTNQVLVLTRAPGLTPEEVERLVTRPVEAALGGGPRAGAAALALALRAQRGDRGLRR